MEIPDLSVSSVWCLDNKVSVVDKIKVSVGWELRDNVEWSFNVKTKLFVEFSFHWISLPFIKIDDIPLLVESIVSSSN